MKKETIDFVLEDKKEFVGDGLMNVMSGLGTSEDKGSYSQFVKRTTDYSELSAMYSGTSMARKVVDIVPGDMTKLWRTFEDTDFDPKKIKEFEREEKRLSLKMKVREALSWARLYGGALIIPIIDNGDGDLSEPLDVETIREGDLKALTVVDAKYAHASRIINQDPTNPNYMMPEYYRLTTASQGDIHHSRVIRFDGLKLPREEFQLNRWWHQSVLDNLRTELTNATSVSDSIAALMHELNLDIINVKGLSNSLAAGQEAKIKQRFEVYNFIKSMFHTAILDEDEKFTNRVMPAAGIDGLIDKFYGLLAAACDIPATRFVGNSPGGLNATGESDLRNYYDNIKDKQECSLAPHLYRLDGMISRSLWGEEFEQVHDYAWVELWQESKKEKADREYVDAQRDALYLTNAVVTEAQVAEELMQNKVYSNIDPAYIKELEDVIDEQDDEEIINAEIQAPTTGGEDQSGED